MKLNISLFKRDIQDFKDCTRHPAGRSNHKSITPKSKKKSPFEYDILLAKGRPNEPKWLPFIKPHVDPDEVSNVKNTVNSAVILLKLKMPDGYRIFAVCTGHGHHLLNKDVIEPQFGLLTTLNGIHPERLKLVDSKKIGVQTLQKREASNLETKLADFDFEFDAEILHVVSGACADENLGTRMSGSDSLHLTSKVDFEALPETCRRIYETFRSEKYKQHFSFIDHVKLEKSAARTATLTAKLVEAINQRVTGAKLSVAYPDQIEYADCDYFRISGLGESSEVNEVTLQVIYDHIGKKAITPEDLKNIKIAGFTDQGSRTDVEPLFAYLTFETKLDDETFVLCNRKWYHINDDYLANVHQDLKAQIVDYKSPGLKPWRQTHNSKKQLSYHEGQYNEQYTNDPDYLLLDRKLYNFGPGFGSNRVEVADLFHRASRKLFCVKRLTASATLSHLFSQATVSAELFRQYPEYKKVFLQQVLQRWPDKGMTDSDIDELTFVYAVGTERPESLLDALPVFSKIMLLKHIRMLKRSKFRVELVRVEMKPGLQEPEARVAAVPRSKRARPGSSEASP